MSERSDEPSVEEVIQHEITEYPTIPVRIDGPVRTQELPSSSVASSNRIAETAASRLMGADPRRKIARILSFDTPIYIGEHQRDVDSGNAFLLPERVLYPITHQNEIWVAVASPTGTSVVSVCSEGWTG